MAEGDGNAVGIAHVDSSDVFNPKQVCRNCGAQNDIATTICVSCGKSVYRTDKLTIEVEDTTIGSNGAGYPTGDPNENGGKSKSLTNLLFDKKVNNFICI